MTKLDINAYGVQELNRQEMVETEGGGIVTLLVIAAVAAACTGCVRVTVNNYGDSNKSNTKNTENNNGIASGIETGDVGSKNGKGNK